ncbi:hypothetical protein PR202_gb08995 [Eleusine coracana subsp. coracana]|uniref:Uncharacterized protein n=1 Tax=Eleusine coracana subsp. coracana TaxID=191504 RepID=A0AAV5EFK9_ELECO|nr:hypothetical protein PR202_gb08995 [Eleusine coracana subsp. coracana]
MVAVTMESGARVVAEEVNFKTGSGAAEAVTFNSGGGVAEAVTFNSGGGVVKAVTLNSGDDVAEAVTIKSGGGVDFGALGPREIGGGAAGVAASTVLEGVALGVVAGDPRPHAHPPLGADPAPAGGADLHWRQGDPLDDDVPANFRLAPGGGMAMASRQAAVLAMILGAMAIIGEPDAPWPNQLVALLLWFGGCIGLFLPRY